MKLLQHTHLLFSLVAVMVVFQLVEISGTEDSSTSVTAAEKVIVIPDTSNEEAAPAASYTESDNSWSFSAHVLEIKDVSIYGRPGSIARIEYLHGRKVREAWAVLRIDNFSFSNRSDIAIGDKITLRVSGNYVSSKGVDWSECLRDEEFCRNASFIEGGFPVSEDLGGLTICPSNTLIYLGGVAHDWINGMLAWRIILED